LRQNVFSFEGFLEEIPVILFFIFSTLGKTNSSINQSKANEPLWFVRKINSNNKFSNFRSSTDFILKNIAHGYKLPFVENVFSYKNSSKIPRKLFTRFILLQNIPKCGVF